MQSPQTASQAKENKTNKLPKQNKKQEAPTPKSVGQIGLSADPFSNVLPSSSILSGAGIIQRKLKIGAHDDAFEREADQAADRIMRMPMSGNAAEGISNMPAASIQRKCSKCEEEEKVRRKPNQNTPDIQAKAGGGGAYVGNNISSQISASQGNGTKLGNPIRQKMEQGFGADFSSVRIHNDSKAASLSRDLNAQAFTVGNDIFFGAGQYQPQSPSGQHLLAHELTHTLQQGGLGTIRKRGPQAKVSKVEISCATFTIDFHTASKVYSYQLNKCNIPTGEYTAGVEIKGSEIKFNINSTEVGQNAIEFGFSVGPNQVSPITLFKGQSSVKMITKGYDQVIKSATTLGEFKKMVKDAAKFRMDANIKHLEAWKTFFTKKLTAKQVEGQVLSHRANELGTMAANEGGMAMYTFDRWAQTRNPLMGWVLEQQIEGRYRACTGCHATVQAQDRWRHRQRIPGAPEPLTPQEKLRIHRYLEERNPAPRPDNLGSPAAIPDAKAFQGYPAATDVMDSVRVLAPYIQILGKSRYNVLPNDIFSAGRSAADTLAIIVARINGRQAAYRLFKTKIDEPGFDYMDLRPVVKDLFQLASPEVQKLVESDIQSAKNWAIVEAIVVGVATIGLVLLAIFPPTSAIGIGGAIALEVGTAAYGIHQGMKMYERGSALGLSQGADDVVDPALQKSADSMMAMGLLTVGLSALSLGATSVRSISLIRGAGTSGKAGAAGVETIEAALENGSTVRITQIADGHPKIVVLGADGKLLAEGTITEAQMAQYVGKPVKITGLEVRGVKGATPRAGSPDRPVSFQGKAGTCGFVSCDMVAATKGVKINPADMEKVLKRYPRGADSNQIASFLTRDVGLPARAVRGWRMPQLKAATAGGDPVIAVIRTKADGHVLHAVVVDGITMRGGQSMVAVRNPWGIQYFQTEAEFMRSFTGHAIKLR